MPSILHIRHDLKTQLNHIVGYCEILIEDAKEYRKADLIPGIEQILVWSDKIKRLINFYYDVSNESSGFSASEVRKAFFLPLMQIITDARRLASLYRQKAPSFVTDMERLLAVASEMYELIENQVMDLELKHVQDSSVPAPPAESRMGAEASPSELPSFDNLEYGDSFAGEQTISPARILLIDDNETCHALIGRHLKGLGHHLNSVYSGDQAFAFLEKNKDIDIIILDLILPGMSGMEILKSLKSDPRHHTIPVIMMSMVNASENIAQCIKLGAEDFLPKDFDPVILRARIDACLEKTRLHREQAVFVHALLESQKALSRELSDAARFVVGLVPPPLETPVKTDIALLPSADLGGDFCSYQWLDQDHLSFFLLDVSGHGIKSALLAVSLSNLIKNRGIQNADFSDPASVLENLNARFQVDVHNSSFFSIWYGVYELSSRTLSYASGGSPPAFLIGRDGHCDDLSTEGLVLGASEDFQFQKKSVSLSPGSKLFLFSDGVYEISRPNGSLLGIDEFRRLLLLQEEQDRPSIDNLLQSILGITMNERFQDDVCICRAVFP